MLSAPIHNQPQCMDKPIGTLHIPFDPNSIVQNARRLGINAERVDILAKAALEQLRSLEAAQSGPITKDQVSEPVKRVMHLASGVTRKGGHSDQSPETVDAELSTILDLIEGELEKHTAPTVEIEESEVDGRSILRYKFNDCALRKYFQGQDPYGLCTQMSEIKLDENRKDIIAMICNHIELAVELGKHLRPQDILSLYAASKAFNKAIGGYMLSSIRIWIAHRCPEAGHVFPFKVYKKHLISDPRGRTWADIYGDNPTVMATERLDKIRTIPGLKYMQLVLGRDRYCREIIAIMARNGHLMPKSMYGTLLRLWLLMDCGITEHRRAMLRNQKLWRDQDLYNAQLLFIKLGMHFNDPIFGPNTYELLHLIMGQRGLYPLWQLLMRKRFTTLSEIVEAKIRYDFEFSSEQRRAWSYKGSLYGVPLWKVGTGHREDWGRAGQHLMRPDELVPLEAVERGLQLDDHLRYMVLWGHIDWETGENIVPTEEDMYISDEEAALAHMDTMHHWRKKHCLKKRWFSLTLEQQQAIRDEDEDERLRAMAWCGEDDDDGVEYHYPRPVYPNNDNNNESDISDDDSYILDDEIDRGFIVPPQPAHHKSTVPAMDDKQGWADFVNRTLIGLPPEIEKDEALRAQALDPALNENFSWDEWVVDNGVDMPSYTEGGGGGEQVPEIGPADETGVEGVQGGNTGGDGGGGEEDKGDGDVETGGTGENIAGDGYLALTLGGGDIAIPCNGM